MHATTNSSAELVRAFMNDALVKGDPNAAKRYFDQEVEYIPITADSPELKAIMPWFGVHRGIEGVEEVYSLILANLAFQEQRRNKVCERVQVTGHYAQVCDPRLWRKSSAESPSSWGSPHAFRHASRCSLAVRLRGGSSSGSARRRRGCLQGSVLSAGLGLSVVGSWRATASRAAAIRASTRRTRA